MVLVPAGTILVILYPMYPSILGCRGISTKRPCIFPFLYKPDAEKTNTYYGCTFYKTTVVDQWCPVTRSSSSPSWGRNDPDLTNVPYYNEWEKCEEECVGEENLSRYWCIYGVIQ